MNAWIHTYWLKIRSIVSRELRANASPLRASLSLAFGILVGFSPFYGIHVFIALPLAFLLKLNRPLVLLTVSATILPVVPFWVAGGIFFGKIVVSHEAADRFIELSRHILPMHLFDSIISHFVEFCRFVIPDRLFDKILPESGHGLLAGVVQWAAGCCVLSLVSAIAMFLVTYPLFLLIISERKKRRRQA